MKSRFNDAGKDPQNRRRGQSSNQCQNHARDAWFADLAGNRESLQRGHEFEQEWWADLDIAFDDVPFGGPPFEETPAASNELDLQGTLADRRRSLQKRLPRFGV